MKWPNPYLLLVFGVLAALNIFFPDNRVYGQDASSGSSKRPVPIRFIDSATGYAIQPESVTALARQPGAKEQQIESAQFSPSARASLMLAPGSHTIAVNAPNYQPMSGQVDVGGDDGHFQIRFLLDPLVTPDELQPDYIRSLHRPDATVIVGFVVDDESGHPLGDVRVGSAPSGVETWTDERGFFQILVPVQSEAEADIAPANLFLEKPGYRTEERQYLELWRDGDWTYRIRLIQGEGRTVVDERELRRRSPRADRRITVPSVSSKAPQQPENLAPKQGQPSSPASATSSSNATVRVPRTIRVLLSDGVTIEYVTLEFYCRRSLPAEWISSWGSKPGGMNSLKAGAVAVRTYAIGYINSPRGTNHDICATTSCQVYGASTSVNTDTAVSQTASRVMLNSNAGITRGLTEYSAENNQLDMSCGDGYTAPTGGCLYDPICAGEAEFGHGRGMCQWGSARWATGLRYAGRSLTDTVTNNYAPQAWIWILQHYYPSLTLAQGAPLVVGDDIKVIGSSNRDVRTCADGSISNGVNCSLITTKAIGSTGVIIAGPVQVTSDGIGYTWWKIQWNDAGPTIGWSAENWLERVFPAPAAPLNLLANAVSSNQITLNWTDNSAVESGFKIERGMAGGGPWLEIDTVGPNVTAYSNKNLSIGMTYYYRVRAYNLTGNSGYSNVTNATTPNLPPVLAAISNRVIDEGTLLTFTNSAAAPEKVQTLADFENVPIADPILFQLPRFSGSTVSFLDAAPDVSAVTDKFPTNGNSSTRVLRANWSFNANANPWLRLTTANTASLPNLVIDFTKQLRFNIYSDKALKIGLGLRETTTGATTPVGYNGGTTGGIEWAGVTNQIGSQPTPNRTVTASNWVTLTFNLPAEPIRNFSAGNGILSTASGLGVLEHLALVPVSATGPYNIYLDNFAVVQPKILTYSLDSGAPSGASVNPTNGIFTWTPSEAQGPGVYDITVRVTDNSSSPQSDAKTFQVTVNEVNQPPVLTSISNRTIHAGTMLMITNSATDPDLPTNVLSFTLDLEAPAGANIDAATGLFAWTPTDAQAESTHIVTARVTDNGSPPLSDPETFTVTVLSRPLIRSITISQHNVTLTWSSITGETYCVQYKSDLNAPWTSDIVGCVVADGPTVTLTDMTASGQTQRFYRVHHGATAP